jgi:hypothetical protein
MADGQLRTKLMYSGQTSVYSTAATPDSYIGRVKSFDPVNNNNTLPNYGSGDGRDPVNLLYGNYDSGGSLRWEVNNFDFLKHWIGFKDGAGTSGDPYKLNEADTTGLSAVSGLQVFTLEVNHINGTAEDVDTYVGCVGSNFSLSGRIGSSLEANATFVARNVISSTSGTTYTTPTTAVWRMFQGTWKWGATPSALAGVQSFTINYNNNLIVNRSADSRFISQPILGTRAYTFSLVIKMESTVATTLRDDFYGQANEPVDGSSGAVATGNEFKIEFTDGTNSANIWLDDCSIDRISKPVSVDGGQMVLLQVDGTAKTGRSNAPISWWS